MRIMNVVQGALLSSAAAVGVALGPAQAGPGGAPIDCSILLCMGSGFPNDDQGICRAAKAEVIRRVTPNPHSEPPLQIWNCPLGASYQPPQGLQSIARIYEASAEMRQQPNAEPLKLWQATIPGVPDADTYDFIQSIRVYNIMHYSHRERGKDDACSEVSSMQLGRYSSNGNYRWSGLTPSDVPAWVGMPRTCNPPSNYRGVAFEWTDYEGNRGTEVVPY
ncbi:hypothetical protein VWY69_00200 [Phaeobacter sp. A90a-4k]|uniref:hypothetical protein n=1 Tax=unclassified Phaeobacter TaxID=2621772 RepID=UPI003A862023